MLVFAAPDDGFQNDCAFACECVGLCERCTGHAQFVAPAARGTLANMWASSSADRTSDPGEALTPSGRGPLSPALQGLTNPDHGWRGHKRPVQ